MLGKDNFSAIPLEKFNDLHYMVGLFGKLANISTETNIKSEVYDSTFKAVISGDVIEADRKFRDVMRFRPFCKLIFAMNNMPRVDDKTHAFFRRLIIIRFDRTFTEEESNRNLRKELAAEMNGIFNVCLEGLKRLRARGYFDIKGSVQDEIQEYRRENNNVLVFIEERCNIVPLDYYTEKSKIYDAYRSFCDHNGYKSLSIRKFGRELKRHCNGIAEDRINVAKIWRGVVLSGEESFKDASEVAGAEEISDQT
jgi:putative DNA primase/helicase